jgi:VWFA-related protein
MTRDQMNRVNDSFGALQDAFSKYDEVAVFTYNKSARLVTDFTGAQSPRLTQAIEKAKSSGEDAMMPGSLSGPLSQTTVINDYNVDPNTAAVRGHTGMQLNPPKETHALNDAIFAAATSLSRKPAERRRVIYVISDGKDYGSTVKQSELIKYLLTNRIEVDGTLVGDSAVWGVGTLDRMHLPLMMRDNVLKGISDETGGNLDSDFRTAAIEKSYSKIAMEARTRYTVGWITHEPSLDGKYRHIEIKVMRPDLTILAPQGYWPWARELAPASATPVATP